MTTCRRLFALFCLLAIVAQGPSAGLSAPTAHAQRLEGDSPFPPNSAPLGVQSSPIKEDDTHFVADSGGDLDQYLYRSSRPDGKLKFNLQIKRYFFNTDDASSNIHFDGNGFLTSASISHITTKKILPAAVKLRMRVYDVDEDASGCPEVDLVYINGQRLEQNGQPVHLSGANVTWSDVSYDVPIGLLKFPQSKGNNAAPTPADNEIAVEIDTLCFTSWAVQVDYAILEITGAVRPIVFVHGWTGSITSFNTIEGRLKTDGIPSGGQANLHEGIYPIPDTADWLNAHIRKAVQEYGVNKINLFAHSKGGLVARRALYDPTAANMVEYVVTFDSPHHGTLWADNEWLMEKVCYWNKYPGDSTKAKLCFDATKEFSTKAVRNTFNYSGCTQDIFGRWINCEKSWIRQPNVDYRAFAADGVIVSPKETTQYPWPWDPDKAPMPSTLNVDAEYDTDHGGILERQDSYQCSIHLLDASRYSCPGSNSSPNAQGSDATLTTADITANQVIFNQQGNLAGAGIFTASVVVDNSTQFVVEAYANTSVDFTLLEPGGRLITPDVANADPLVDYTSDLTFGLSHSTYIIANPAPGTWQVRVQSNGAAEFVFTGKVDSPVSLEVIASKASYLPGETITVQAALIQSGVALSGGTVTGEFEQPNGAFVPVNFYDNGTNGDPTNNDGIFTAQFIALSAQANLYLNVAADRNATHREKSLLLAVSNQTATILGVTGEWASDDDADGLIDRLVIQVDINILQNGYFDLQGSLVGSNATFIQSAQSLARSQSPTALTPGVHSVVLEFDGQAFWEVGQDGPYTLTDLFLSDSTNQLFQVDTATNLHTTVAYSRSQFEQPILWFASGSETATDQNYNNRYDVLAFHLQFGIVRPGNYTLNGRLVDQDGGEIGWGVASVYIPASGTYLLDLPFAGSDIGGHQVDGPYYLKDVSLFNQEGTAAMYFASLGATSAYKFTQFENGYYRLYLPLTSRNFSNVIGFNSQFNGSATGWGSHSGVWAVDSYYYSTLGVAGAWASASYAANYTNFDYQVRLWRYGCDTCSNHLAIRGTPTPLSSDNTWYSYYIFQYTRDGWYSVWKSVGGSAPVAVQNWAATSAINTYSAWNTLRVIASGSSLYFYINGILVWVGTDTSLTFGRAGIGMYRTSSSIGDQLYVDWATLTPFAADEVHGPTISDTVAPAQQALNEAANESGTQSQDFTQQPSK